LIQIFAEYEMKDVFSQKLRMHPKYSSAWQILTAGWGIFCLSKALMIFTLLHIVSLEIYYAISSISSHVATPLFLLFSFCFQNGTGKISKWIQYKYLEHQKVYKKPKSSL
jgi:hypothetical protein